MKGISVFLGVLLFAFAALAGEKDVNVVNTVGVDVLTLPDDSLELNGNYHQVNLDCVVPPSDNKCGSSSNPDSTAPKLIHTVTVSVLVKTGEPCSASVAILDFNDFGFARQILLHAYATERSPGVVSISYPRPIRIEDRDFFSLAVSRPSTGSGCEGRASLGVEVP